MKNNKYKPVEIRGTLHHTLKLKALAKEVLLRDLASAIIEAGLADEQLIDKLISQLTNQRRK